MTYIIADPCLGTCDTACVEVCPVDCIHGPDDKEGSGSEAKEAGFDPTGKMLSLDYKFYYYPIPLNPSMNADY